MYNRINLLDKHTAELIAAGEVVERPSSVVKELAENSIDAKAAHITVEIRDGGISYIRITDDGCGIARDDVKKAFLRHATSKVLSEEDLSRIDTLGFRGEALPSIASVARVDMLTKTKDEPVGTLYRIHGSEEVSFDDAGCPDGTTITVKDLFYNTPARMKFLKKNVSEANAVADVVERLALSHPEVSFRLLREGKEVILTPGDGKLISAIRAVYGKEFSSSLIPAEYSDSGMSVHGYISKPVYSRPTRAMQTFFVNGRFVRTGTGAAALSEAYKNSVMTGKFPACVLMIETPFEFVDANVHPAKTEIRFADERKVFSLVYYAAKNALMSGDTRKEAVLKTDGGFKKPPRPFEKPKDYSLRPSAYQTNIESLFSVGKRLSGEADNAGQKQRDNSDTNTGAPGGILENTTQNRSFTDGNDGVGIPGKEGDGSSRFLTGGYDGLTRENPASLAEKGVFYDSGRLSRPAGGLSGFSSENSADIDIYVDDNGSGATDIEKSGDVHKNNFSAGPENTGNSSVKALRTDEDPFTSEKSGEDGNEHKKTDDDIAGKAVSKFLADGENIGNTGDITNVPDDYNRRNDVESDGGYDDNGYGDDIVPSKKDVQIKLMGEAFNTYIFAQVGQKILVIDKHAAHERMIFDRLRSQKWERASQQLMSPIRVRLSRVQYDAVINNISVLRDAGIDVEDFGDCDLLVRGVPLLTDEGDISSLLEETAQKLIENRSTESGYTEWVFHSVACRAAVKAGDHSEPQELKALIKRIVEDDSIRYCPHGRPVAFYITRGELERQFSRT